ncbi:lysozyme inhibitor LprI family protein [Methylocystis sp.]|uniref:lysozyme inhibitor LprI family protein n=1 Tax=Methylocystis sp. TaxID=1911079 RepID=UPI0025D02FE5|nr:lysozyme inhibitor LprI family protein [Methylocystis sp.]
MKIFPLRCSIAVAVAFVVLAHWSSLAMAKDCSGLDTQTAMNLCAGDNFKQSDAELNAVYQKLLSKISPGGQSKLREAQKSWIRYRDQQCEFDTMGTIGGSIHSMMLWQCLTDLTAQQTKMLQHQLNCQEGDVSCGGQ